MNNSCYLAITFHHKHLLLIISVSSTNSSSSSEVTPANTTDPNPDNVMDDENINTRLKASEGRFQLRKSGDEGCHGGRGCHDHGREELCGDSG
jgi:hypothetical protein